MHVGQGDFLDGRAQLAVFVHRRMNQPADVGIQALTEEFLRQADAQAGQTVVQRGRVIRYRLVHAG